MHNIDWIFFDVGGVILDDHLYEKTRIDELFHVIHIFDSRVTRQQVADAMPAASARVGQINENILSMFIPDISKLHMARNMMAGKRQIMYKNRGVVRPEALEVLSALSQNYNLGLIANQPKSSRDLLASSGLDKFFNHFKVSDDHGLAKPDVLYFKTVLKENGAEAQNSIMIDDNIERGLLPAKRLGMTTVWFKTSDRNDPPLASVDCTITNLKELLKIDWKDQ